MSERNEQVLDKMDLVKSLITSINIKEKAIKRAKATVVKLQGELKGLEQDFENTIK